MSVRNVVYESCYEGRLGSQKGVSREYVIYLFSDMHTISSVDCGTDIATAFQDPSFDTRIYLEYTTRNRDKEHKYEGEVNTLYQLYRMKSPKHTTIYGVDLRNDDYVSDAIVRLFYAKAGTTPEERWNNAVYPFLSDLSRWWKDIKKEMILPVLNDYIHHMDSLFPEINELWDRSYLSKPYIHAIKRHYAKKQERILNDLEKLEKETGKFLYDLLCIYDRSTPPYLMHQLMHLINPIVELYTLAKLFHRSKKESDVPQRHVIMMGSIHIEELEKVFHKIFLTKRFETKELDKGGCLLVKTL